MLGVFADAQHDPGTSPCWASTGQGQGETPRPAGLIPARLENAIREALNKPGRPGVRKIAERFGVDLGTAGLAARGHLVAAVAASRLQLSDGGRRRRGPPDDPLARC
jgi:hypothetical protein